MSSFFDQEYDNMSWSEVCYRLPSELAVNALKRRVTNLDTLMMFFEHVHSQPASIKPLREHINSVISNFTVDEVFDKFDQEHHPVLFNWLNSDNKERLRKDGQENLSHKFLFNLSGSNDIDGLNKVLDKVLEQDPPKHSEILSVLNKVSNVHFNSMLEKVLRDKRPEVKVCVLSVGDVNNEKLISNYQKVIGLKAMIKAGYSSRLPINTLDFKVFSDLRPAERMVALKKYLERFPKYRQIQVFDPMPTEDEFQLVLFAGCIEHNEEIKKLNELYQEITTLEPPKEEEDEEDSP